MAVWSCWQKLSEDDVLGRLPGIRYAVLDAQYAKEQEAIRKKEELKDKRHQAYLCRKVSGWQRQHEERTKAAKKTKTDNGKAAIRQEDIRPLAKKRDNGKIGVWNTKRYQNTQTHNSGESQG